MTNVSNACAALTHMNVCSITGTDRYSEDNGRLCAMLMVTMSDGIWT